MAFIVFRIFPQLSHHNSTFYLARQLQDRGHRVMYVGHSDMQGLVLGNGFEYHVLRKDIYPKQQPIKNAESISFVIKHFRARRKFFKKLHIDFLRGYAFEEVIQLKADLLIVDSPFVRQALALIGRNINFAIIETMVSLHKDRCKPPLDSLLAPKDSLIANIRIELAWQRYFFVNQLKRLIGNMMPSTAMIKKFCARNNINPSVIDLKRYLHPGLNNVPELILSPEEFDFPHEKKKNQFYVGPAIDFGRNTEIQDLNYSIIIDQFARIKNINNKSREQGEFVIYCSFGSAPWRYGGAEGFFAKLIEILKRRRQWKLIISIGTEMDYKRFDNVTDNIRIFQIVPQIDVLRRVDLMITHGGMNSINECIQAGVPMLVLPGLRYLDQVGNAARVKYHGLGLSGSLRKETRKSIENKMNTILSTQKYKMQVDKMREKIKHNRNFEKGPDIIERILNRRWEE